MPRTRPKEKPKPRGSSGGNKTGGNKTGGNKTGGSSQSTPKYRKIQIKGTEGATITVNGTKISQKVPHSLTNGPTGRYVFLIEKDGFKPYVKTIDANILGTYTVHANLESEPVVIAVVTTATEESSTMAAIAQIIMEDDDESEEGSYAGDNLGNIGFGSDGVSPGAVIEEGVGEVDIQQMEEELKENPEVQRVVKITEIVNDDTLTEEEKSNLLDCYRVDDDTGPGGRTSTKKDGQNSRSKISEDIKKVPDGGTGGDIGDDTLSQRDVFKLIDRNGEEAYGSTLGEGYADFDMKYNYVSYEFEDYVLAETPPVTRLPSFANFINLGERDIEGVNDQSAGSLTYPPNEDGEEMLPREPRTYFGTLLSRPENHKFAHYRMEYRSAGSVSIYYNDLFSSLQTTDVEFGNLEHLNKNYIFHEPFIAKMREKNYLKKHFPIYVNIELSPFKPQSRGGARPPQAVADILRKNNMQGMFMNTIMSWALETPTEVLQDQEGKLIKYWKDVPMNSSNLRASPYNTDNSIHFFGPQSEESALDAGAYDAALEALPPLRTAINETIMFKVSKYKKGSPEPIQNFFFFNDSKAGPIQFIDTQLNLAESYEYRVFSYDILKLGLKNSLVQLIEYETFHQDDVYVVSRPPMPPDVTIAPYMGSETDMLFLFNDSSGKVLMEPISLDENDVDRLGKIRKIYGRRVPNPELSEEEFNAAPDGEKFKNLIEYEYDGSSIFFEVYRTTEPPRSYADFAGKRITRTTGTSFKDGIAPNTKYYYTFRCMDNHGNFSNPSAVFEVEIVKTFNVFPNIRVYEFPDTVKETRETKRSMKRFLRITPDTKFMFVRETGGNPDYTLGADNIIESLWNKKFKLRMTSKTTGKKIDLNFSFTKSFIGNT